mgnify:FL=1
MQTKLIIEQHFHGCFGIDFNKASVDDVLYLSKEILKYGIGGIFPTLVTDSVENIKKATAVIKEASQKQTSDMAKILGIHLEGIFINPEKKGIHNPKHFLAPTIENYKLVEDDFIKIVTLAPEMINSHRPVVGEGRGVNVPPEKNLISYLRSKNIKVQAGHCVGGNLTGCTGVTHLFNAMSGVAHRGETTALSALVDDNIYTEIIGDGIHVSDKALELVFKSKPLDKIILISDSLPCTNYPLHLREGKQLLASDRDVGAGCYEFTFADEKVYYDGIKATSKEGTIAGSTTMIPKIIKRLMNTIFRTSTLSTTDREKMLSQLVLTPYSYHNIDLDGSIEWDEDFNIAKVNKK